MPQRNKAKETGKDDEILRGKWRNHRSGAMQIRIEIYGITCLLTTESMPSKVNRSQIKIIEYWINKGLHWPE
jgi:hypothetical protein